ncbi:putative F-box domain, leucine-rich repeat domain superfamily, F-box-like domain superfamily [Helianthus annuus]|nr:putative F-box domain, leucine-rich repeat domain superfamily, F-box-like domain superfamily [Helianthus annuus]
MGSRCDRKRMNVEGDRLSGLPDELIHIILSFVDIKHAIKTSVLSSRWRYTWTSLPYLNFIKKDHDTVANFTKFVTCVMSGRNNQIEVSSVQITFHGKHSQVFFKRILDIILNCESSHNVQQLNITNYSNVKKIESPLSLFSSQSLKHLTLTMCTYKHRFMTTPICKLPTLTTLNLYRVTFYDGSTTDKCSGLFSNFGNLKNLTLKDCYMEGLNDFDIRHPRLSNLTLEGGTRRCNVVTPQLKNLTIRYWRKMFMISAPDLASLHYKDSYYTLQLSADFPHLEKVDMWISHPSQDTGNARKIVNLLQQIRSVNFLTLNLEIIELLSSSLVLTSHLHSPFTNLKSLRIYPAFGTRVEQTQRKVAMSTEVKSYLVDASPGATFTMVSHEVYMYTMKYIFTFHTF